VIAERDGVVLREAREADLPAIDALTSLGYAPIQESNVDTGLDDAHIPARRAYKAVGFDRSVPSVDLWQRL
jgi:hypothetical protein